MRITNKLTVEKEDGDPSPAEWARMCNSDERCPLGVHSYMCPFPETPCRQVTPGDWQRATKHASTTVTLASVKASGR